MFWVSFILHLQVLVLLSFKRWNNNSYLYYKTIIHVRMNLILYLRLSFKKNYFFLQKNVFLIKSERVQITMLSYHFSRQLYLIRPIIFHPIWIRSQSERRMVFLVRMVGLQHPLRPRCTKEDANVHESHGHEWGSSLSGSSHTEGRVQSFLSR